MSLVHNCLLIQWKTDFIIKSQVLYNIYLLFDKKVLLFYCWNILQKCRTKLFNSYSSCNCKKPNIALFNFNLHISVEAGHRAIIFSRLGGIQKDIMAEGLHFRIPWFHYPIIYDIRSRPRKISSPTGSKDLQMVNISLRVLSRPEASTLPIMYRQLGLDYDEKVR